MKRAISLAAILGGLVAGCGGNEPGATGGTGSGTDGRQAVATKLEGTYRTRCEDGVLQTVTIGDARYAYRKETFSTENCTGAPESVTTKTATITVEPVTDRNGFTHRVRFDEGGGVVYERLVSLAPSTLKFENESEVYWKR